MDIKKTIGIALCCLFGGQFIGFGYDLVYSWAWSYIYSYIDFDSYITVNTIVWAIIDLIVCFVFFYAYQRRNGIFSNKVGKIATLGIICVYGLFAVNQVVYLCTSSSMFAFLGNRAFLILRIIEAFLVVAFLFSSKAWLPIKIIGSISYFHAIMSSVFGTELSNLYSTDDYDFELISKISHANYLCGIFVVILSLCAIILTLIWMTSKKMRLTGNKQTLDII